MENEAALFVGHGRCLGKKMSVVIALLWLSPALQRKFRAWEERGRALPEFVGFDYLSLKIILVLKRHILRCCLPFPLPIIEECLGSNIILLFAACIIAGA